MKPAWDQLAESFADKPYALIGDVDCTAAGKPICQANGVRGYPTIKYGDVSDLQQYKGKRDFDGLKEFADANLKPICSPFNTDSCSEEQKSQIEQFQKLSLDEIDNLVTVEEKKIADAEKTYDASVAKLQKEKEDAINAVKDAGLGLLKSVKASKATVPNDEL